MSFNPRWFALCVASAALLWIGICMAAAFGMPAGLPAGIAGSYLCYLAFDEDQHPKPRKRREPSTVRGVLDAG